MSGVESWTLDYVLNAAWQAPLLFTAAWLADWLLRSAAPGVRHKVWVIALACEVLLPACSLPPGWLVTSTAMLREWLFGTAVAAPGHVTVVVGAGYIVGGVHATPLMVTAIACAYAASVVFFSARLIVAAWRTAALRRGAMPIPSPARDSQRYARVFGVREPKIALSTEVASPVTLGIWGHTILLPAEMSRDVAEDDVAAALAHEFAHIRRADFAKNLVHEILSLPLAFHPILWLTRQRIAESREMVCDAMAADAVDGKQKYARSLLRLATDCSARTATVSTTAIGIFDANTFKNFERRIMNLTENRMPLSGTRRTAVLTLCGLLGAVACCSALGMRMQVATRVGAPASAQTVQSPATPHTPAASQPAAEPAQILVALPKPAKGEPVKSFTMAVAPADADTARSEPATEAEVVQPRSIAAAQAAEEALRVGPGIMAGNLVTKVNPVYPPDAKAAGIEGAVVLKAVIGMDGAIKNLEVVSGPQELQAASIDAVRQWVYKPYLLNGNPVEVETTITVHYSLAK
jgi:TonB family protein